MTQFRKTKYRKSAVLLLAASLFASVMIVAPQAAAQDAAPKPTIKVVQLGDSYSAGNGARAANGDRNYVGVKGCYRSPTNWGGQFVDTLRDDFNVVYVNRACSGGVIGDIQNDRLMENPRVGQLTDCPEPRFPDEEFYVRNEDGLIFDRCERRLFPQINAIDESVDLVMMTGGGNDAEFAKVVEQCFVVGFRDPGDCREAVDFGNGRLDRIETDLTNTLRELRSRMRDDAKIVFVAYPYLIDDIDYELVSLLRTDRFDAATEVRALGLRGDQGQRAAIDAINAELGEDLIIYVDGIKDLFNGHAPNPVQSEPINPDRWLYEAIETRVPAEYYHYKPRGHLEIKNLLVGRDDNLMLPDGPAAGGGGADLDIVFVVDTTGSMGGEIAQVRANLTAFVNQLDETTDSFRVGVVSYRDFSERTGSASDYPARVDQTFTDDLPSIQAAIDGLSASGGGDFPETVFSGLDAAFGLPWRPGVTKVAIVIGDAPAHSPEPISGLTAAQLVAKSLAIDPVQVVGVDVGSLSEAGLQEITAGTGGSIVPSAGDLIGVISEILGDVASQPFAWPGGPYAGFPGEAIEFDASGSFDPSGTAITLYEWDFDGDGEFDLSSASPIAEHVYDEDYDGVVVVRVTDGEGESALGSTRVDVNEAGSAPQGDSEACEIGEDGLPVGLGEDGIPLRCTLIDMPTEDAEGIVIETGDDDDDGPADCDELMEILTPTHVGDDEANEIRGTRGDDIIFGMGGNDIIFGLGGNDIICGGDGNDRIDGGSGVDELYGGDGNDRVYGRNGDDLMFGGDGNDYMAGAGGSDEMYGNTGNDRMFGQNGPDRMYGNSGDDVLNGGRQADTVDGGLPDAPGSERNRCIDTETELNCGTVVFE